MQNLKKCPVGIQRFHRIIEGGFLYVDKTEYVYNITHGTSLYYFLSRPRRFGKTMFVSTLQSYFEGRKDLFKGLAIEKQEKDWIEYPVIHLDLSMGKDKDKNGLIESLLDTIHDEELRLDTEVEGTATDIRLKNLILALYKKTGKKVVILIDEYDAPLLDVDHEEKRLEELHNVMKNFYSPLKKCEDYLQFVFISGITKFSQLSIFSTLNNISNISNISMLGEFAGVCGITETELNTTLRPHVEEFALAKNKSYDEMMAELKDNYDGHHFTWPSEDIYNPFSLLKALANNNIDNYWFASGTPTYLLEILRKFRIPATALFEPMDAIKDDFDAPTESMTGVEPLFYQSGYITIKDCSPSGLYTLGIPNKEVRIGLLRNLIPHYLGVPSVKLNSTCVRMQDALLNNDIDKFMLLMQTFIGTIPGGDYVDKSEHFEAHWQKVLSVIFSLLGATVAVEVRTHKGRIDLEARTAQKIYILELKMGKTKDEAMKQIDENNYDAHYALSGLPVVRVSAVFSEEEKNITEWMIVEG